MGPVDESLVQKFSELWPHLNERQGRLVVGAEAKALGRGGVTAAARAAGISRPTVQRAMVELSEPPEAIAPARSRSTERSWPEDPSGVVSGINHDPRPRAAAVPPNWPLGRPRR